MLLVGVRRLSLEWVFGASGSFVWIAEMFVGRVVEIGMKVGRAGLLGFLARAAGLSIGLLSLGFQRLG